MGDDNRVERREQSAIQKFADSAMLKVATSFLTLIMVPLIWRIADTISDLRTNGALMELRVHRLEDLVPVHAAQYSELHDGVNKLQFQVDELNRTCRRVER